MSPRATRFALLLAGAGAVLVMVGVLGTVVELCGLAAVLLGTVLSAPAGRNPGAHWWGLLASGAVLSVLGAIVALASEGTGGLLALIGGVAVLVGAAIGFPAGTPQRPESRAPRSTRSRN